MPAAAVIPAPIAYIKVAAVKKLVVGFHYPDQVARLVDSVESYTERFPSSLSVQSATAFSLRAVLHPFRPLSRIFGGALL